MGERKTSPNPGWKSFVKCLIFAATSSLAGNLNLSYYTWTGMREGGNLVLRGASIDPGGGDFPPNKRGGGLEPDRSFTRLLCKADQHSLYLYIKVLQHWRLQGYLHLPFFFSIFFLFFSFFFLFFPQSSLSTTFCRIFAEFVCIMTWRGCQVIEFGCFVEKREASFSWNAIELCFLWIS